MSSAKDVRCGRLMGLLLGVAIVAGCGDATDTEVATSVERSSECGVASEPSGVLRIAEFSTVATFDPPAAQIAQTAYLYPVYDTLTRQDANFELHPALATEWSQPEPTVWQFKLREDVVFHDGELFDADAVKANLERAASFKGNANAAAFGSFVNVDVVDQQTVNVNFSAPSPAFPLEMSMITGMMVSPEGLEGDLTRSPAGSGPWIWQESESQAGVREVYTLNPEYWDPTAQGVERIEVLAVPDNDARLNALRTGEVDLMATVRERQISTIQEAGLGLITVSNFLPYILITDREGDIEAPLADLRVRQAIFYAIDRHAYVEVIQDGQGDAKAGMFPESMTEFYDSELDDAFAYDPERARQLLTEAGYPDGIDLQMPVMPVISAQVESLAQMLGQSGIRVTLAQLPNGQMAPAMRNGEYGLTWLRSLVYHPSQMFETFLPTGAPYNPFDLEDTSDLVEMMGVASATEDLAARNAIYGDIQREMMERGILMPLGHGLSAAAHQPNVTCLVLGLNMQAPMPYGIRVD